MKAKINFKKAGHFFEAGNNAQTQEQVAEQAAKKARRNKIIKWTVIGAGATGLTVLGVKGIKKLVGKKAQEVPAPEDQQPEAPAEETEKKPTGKKADK